MDPLNCIELTLKTPNQSFDDIQLKCQEDWTVAKLKEHLQDVYPSKPKSSSQKLIYLGKLLQDHVVLKEVITNCARTLHIVCHEAQTEASSSSKSAESSTPRNNTQNIGDGVRFRGHQQTQASPPPQAPASQYQQPPSPLYHMASQNMQQHPNFQQFQNYQWQQHYQMQHIVQQYYMQMQQWQQAMSTGQWPVYPNSMNPYPATPSSIPSTPTQTPSTPATPSVPNTPPAQERPQEEAAPAPRQPPQANRNLPMNAGPGGAIMQDDENDNNNPANRDWLDWVYMSMRGFMLLSIIYFYSSTSRFLLVALLGFIVYLYQGGWFSPRRVEQPAPVQADPPQNRDDIDGNNTDQNNEAEQPPAEPPRPGVFRILCTFMVSFVTSLIPATPPPLQQN